jgi:hypothetical protein
MHSNTMYDYLPSNHLALTVVDSNPDTDLDLSMWVSYPASLRDVGGSTQVLVRSKIIHGRVPEVFLRQ